MNIESLNCCGKETSPINIEHQKYIDCYKSKKFFKKKTKDGREIKKEIVLVVDCSVCKHYIIKFLWYTKKNTRFFDYDDSKILKGKKADEIFTRYGENYYFYTLPNPYKNAPLIKQSKKIPWVYGKFLNETTQVPRYYNESSNAGKKIYTPLKIQKS